MNSELERRFDQAGMTTAAKREEVLLNSARGLDSVISALQLPTREFESLALQLKMLVGLTKDQSFHTVQDLGRFMATLQPQTRGLFSEVEKLIHLCLCLPVSTACSERSFSALRRLKTWLRSTVSQSRLTHMALLHVHKDILDDLNLQDVIGEFISRTPERKTTFGGNRA